MALRVAAVGASLLWACNAVSLPTPTSVLEAAALADSYWNANNAPGDCGWTRGTLFAGKTAYYNITQSPAGEREFNRLVERKYPDPDALRE